MTDLTSAGRVLKAGRPIVALVRIAEVCMSISRSFSERAGARQGAILAFKQQVDEGFGLPERGGQLSRRTISSDLPRWCHLTIQ